jgi:asparagine synthase (glutamine-hydrolysing)
MCGIAGRLNYASGAPVDPGALRSMARLLAHRGPDGEGVWSADEVGLAHRRLAIIDLSEAAAQPMASADGAIWITFNGEIYNFQDVRRELEGHGASFRSQSDTEVIIAAYQQWDVGCLERLRGMFAFAIWDGRRQRLLLARDRLGMKPLWYRTDADGIAFASEAKAFLAERAYVPDVDPEGISQYLTYQYVPAPASAFRSVRKLPPAHFLLVENGKLDIRRYWRLRYEPKRRIREAAAADELVARLREAVRLRLVSDVPLGAFLSGGLDSSAVVALMAQETNRPVKTFSIGFDEPEYDELPYARMVAERYGTDHREFVVRPDAIQLLPKIVWHYGEPFADSSAIPTYCLAEHTRQHVTVALNGDGGDESFAGYERYLAHVAAGRADHLPRPLRQVLAALTRRLGGHSMKWTKGVQLLAAYDVPRERRYAYGLMHFQPELKAELCTPEFLASAGGRDETDVILEAYARSDASDFLDRTLDVDVNRYLPDDLLVKVDAATMAHGLEARSPLLDHPFMEFAASLPPELKLHGLVKKYIFKHAVAGLLPDVLINRRKMGFGVPIDHWFRGELGGFASDVLLSRASIERGYFRPEVVRRLLEEHVAGIRAWHYQLWNLLVLELWHRAFIDARPQPTEDSVLGLGRSPSGVEACS